MDETTEDVFHQHPEWKVFSLTYVEYPTGDKFGKALAMLSLAPLVIVVASVSVFAVKRDLHTMAYGAGMIGNGIVSLNFKYCMSRQTSGIRLTLIIRLFQSIIVKNIRYLQSLHGTIKPSTELD